MILRYFYILILLSLTPLITACGAGAGNPQEEVSKPSEIKIIAATTEYRFGDTSELRLLAIYGNTTSVEVTSSADWESSDNTLASVSKGFVEAHSNPGKATITARYGGLDASVEITVLPPPVLEGVVPSIGGVNELEVGQTVQVVLLGQWSDDRQTNISDTIEWSSSDKDVVTIDEDGLLNAVDFGEATITAKYQEFSGEIHLKVLPQLVDFELNKDSYDAIVGMPFTIELVGIFADGSRGPVDDKLNWSTADKEALSVSESGLVLPRRPGVSTLTVSLGDKQKEITVSAVTRVIASKTEKDSIELQWFDMAATRYYLYWSTEPSVSKDTANQLTIEADSSSRTTNNEGLSYFYQYVQLGLKPGSTYYYRLSAEYTSETDLGKELSVYLPKQRLLKPISVQKDRFDQSFAVHNASLAYKENTQQLFITGGDTAPNHTHIFEPVSGATFNATKMTTSRTGHVSCFIDKSLYVMGGIKTVDNNPIEYYDTVNKSWETSPVPLNDIRIHSACVTNGQFFYLIGGQDENGGKLNLITQFNFGQSNQVEKTAMNTARSKFAAYIKDNKIYVAGGITTTGVTDNVEVYSILDDKWVDGVALPQPRYGFQLLVKGNDIYAIGGFHADDSPYIEIERFDGTSWTQLTSVPSAQSHYYSLIEDDLIYLIGDFISEKAGGEALIYSIIDDKWYPRKSIDGFRKKYAAAQLDKYVYLLGGANKTLDTLSDKFQRYDLDNDKWEDIAKLSVSRFGAAAVGYNGKVYFSGGIDKNNDIVDFLDVYDPANDTWTALAPIPEPRQGHTLTAVQGKLYLVGGTSYVPDFNSVETGNGGVSTIPSSVYIYDPDYDQWYKGKDLVYNFTYATAVALGESIYYIGGRWDNGVLPFGDTNKIQSYDTVRQQWQTITSNPNIQRSPASTLRHSTVYVFGGGTGNTIKETNLVSEPVIVANSELTLFQSATEGFAANYQGRIYYIGGVTYNDDFLATEIMY